MYGVYLSVDTSEYTVNTYPGLAIPVHNRIFGVSTFGVFILVV